MGSFTTIDQVVNIYIFRFLADLLIPCRFTRWAIRYRLPFIFENKNQSNWGFGFSVVFAHKSLGYQRNSRVHEPCIQIVRGQLARPNGFFANQSPKKRKTDKNCRETNFPSLCAQLFCFQNTYTYAYTFSRAFLIFLFSAFLAFCFSFRIVAHTTSRKQFAVFTHILWLI